VIRVALLGYGFIGRVHLAHLRRLRGVQVVAVVESDPEKLRTLVRGNIPAGEEEASVEGLSCLADVADVLGRPDVDVVDICLPTHLHKDVALRALEAGHHVICEKPLALSLADVDEILARAERSGRRLLVAHCIRFWPEYEFLQSLVQSGQFGRPRSAIFRRVSPFPTWGGSDGWFSDPQKSGGALLDLHIHDVDIAQLLFGRPRAVFARASWNSKGASTCVFAQHIHEGGPLVFLEGSWEHAAFEMSFHVAFEEAEVRYNSQARPALRVIRRGRVEPEFPEIPGEDGYARELRYFVECLESGREPSRVSLPSIRSAMEIAFAELESARTGNVVFLAE